MSDLVGSSVLGHETIDTEAFACYELLTAFLELGSHISELLF